MQHLDEEMRAGREVEDNEDVARICDEFHIPLHKGRGCVLCTSVVTRNSDVVACKRCRHLLADSLDLCPLWESNESGYTFLGR